MLFGRYIVGSFSLLRQRLNRIWRQRVLGRQYVFTYIKPQVQLQHQSVYYQEWKPARKEERHKEYMILAGLMMISLWATDLVYTLLYNDKVAYYYYTNFSLNMWHFDRAVTKISQFLEPWRQIYPQNEYQLNTFWAKATELLLKTQQRAAKEDRKVYQLRREIQQFDKKYEKQI